MKTKKRSARKPTKNKRGRPRGRLLVRRSKLIKTVVKNEGNLTASARELGVTPQTVMGHINRHPEIKEAVENVRLEALRKAGLDREIVYRVVRQGLDADKFVGIEGRPEPDYAVRHKYVDTALHLLGDLKDQPQAMMNIFMFEVPQKDPLPQ